MLYARLILDYDWLYGYLVPVLDGKLYNASKVSPYLHTVNSTAQLMPTLLHSMVLSLVTRSRELKSSMMWSRLKLQLGGSCRSCFLLGSDTSEIPNSASRKLASIYINIHSYMPCLITYITGASQLSHKHSIFTLECYEDLNLLC